jgi:DnaK suppressor protein
MNKDQTEQFKKQLLAEKAMLEKELGKIGKKDSASPGGWDATSTKMDIDSADDNEVADKLESMDENIGIVNNLEKQLLEVSAALERIENGTYGKDEKTGEPIDMERLKANPSARFAIK